MKISRTIRQPKGQALAEMVLSIPLLFLLAAGPVQFTILFLSYVQFEHACGEAARLYAAKVIDKDSLGPKIMENLVPFDRYFDQDTLTVNTQNPQSTGADIVEKARSFISIIPFVTKYDGAEWKVQVRFKPPFLITPLFRDGILFQTVMQIYRFPG